MDAAYNEVMALLPKRDEWQAIPNLPANGSLWGELAHRWLSASAKETVRRLAQCERGDLRVAA